MQGTESLLDPVGTLIMPCELVSDELGGCGWTVFERSLLG